MIYLTAFEAVSSPQPFPCDRIVIPTGAYPDFLLRSTGQGPCAPFRKEGRMKFDNATKIHRKSGVA
jgi:hypothetical protein